MTNPYLITGPALISFSGGRTSGYMLWHILDAHGGTLPDDVHVCFANTGKEREETLRFVHDCATHWGVQVRWLEWQARGKGKEGRNTPPSARFIETGYNSASRNGEPLAAIIERKSYLPNVVTRFCTMEAKIEVLKWFMLSLGYANWSNVVGLRWDEMHRVMRAIERNEKGGDRWTTVMPMARQATKVRKDEVARFWAEQPFDLQLQSYEGNCDLCFLKGAGKLKRLIRDNPGMADWWIAQEKPRYKQVPVYTQPDYDAPDEELASFEPELIGFKEVLTGTFNKGFSYADLVREVSQSPLLPMSMEEGDEFDAECGLWCSGEP
jgi:3'-phosphoadenosine 5'-phosphosulfate sulfotransferase (PAPS reductase)/FAD synthetase